MHMESLEDDNFEEFKGGTLEINPEFNRLSNDNSPEMSNNLESIDNELNANLDSTSISNLIAIPKRITESLWSCQNNNNPIVSRALTSSAAAANVLDDAKDYFTFRDGVVEKAVHDCAEKLVETETDGELIYTFLLTEITSWDTEKERLVILTKKALYSVKYDFIALKQLAYRRVSLEDLEVVVIGDLVYPAASLVPRLNGLANGVSDVMKGVLHSQYFEGKLFEPSDRKSRGVRLIWNVAPPKNFTQKWNPFNSDGPYLTFAAHPLFRQADTLTDVQKEKFSMDAFYEKLIHVIEDLSRREYLIQHKDIVVKTYLGIGSLIYNRNSLGFFKVRGKFSF